MNAIGIRRIPLLSNDDAWQRLPGAPELSQQLPMWARMFVGPLPLTTARALELDAMHRSGDRLDGRLRALVRWAAADANGCNASKKQAIADFRRTGSTEELTTLAMTPGEQSAVAFARRLMAEAYAITDDEMKLLAEFFTEEQVVGLVALLAHASYQDRIILALGAAEDEVTPPPVTVRFARPKPTAAPPTPILPADPTAITTDRERFQTGIDSQKTRPGHIRIPSHGEALRRMGDGHPMAWQVGLAWSRVCYGFQPELTDAWFACTGAFRQETDLDMVFQNAVFWVITESLQCFY